MKSENQITDFEQSQRRDMNSLGAEGEDDRMIARLVLDITFPDAPRAKRSLAPVNQIPLDHSLVGDGSITSGWSTHTAHTASAHLSK